MSIRVIGAGFGRTGTYSLKLALEELGLGSCYHMFELFDHPQGVKYWKQAMRGEEVNWAEIFEGYQAIVDFPGCLYVKELMEAYPEAKVVLTIRDPESWWESASKTILSAEPGMGVKMRMAFRYPFVKRVREVMEVVLYNVKDIYQDCFEGKPGDRETAIRVFNAHNEAIRQLVPSEKLLVYEVKEGWAPLCDFLGVPAPDSDFPRVNSKTHFQDRIDRFLRA